MNMEKAQKMLDMAKRDDAKAIELSNEGNLALLTGYPDKAIACFQEALEYAPHFQQAASSIVFCMNYSPKYTAEDIYTTAKYWAKTWMPKPENAPPLYFGSLVPDKKIRVGYVSGDFREHTVYRYIINILKLHDKENFEVFLYSNFPGQDEYTKQLAKYGKLDFVDQLTDEQAQQRIFKDGIDILIDLSEHTNRNRMGVFALRAAPIQCGYIGYPGTSGLKTMDYYIGDEKLCEGLQPYFTEKLLMIPGGCVTLEMPEVEIKPTPSDHVRFGCFHSTIKINQEVVETWAEILKAVPNSTLELKSHLFKTQGDSYWKRFEDLGIERNRILLNDFSPKNEYYDAYNSIDIVLDTFPYCGSTTTCDALWMGSPIVSLRGQTMAGRAPIIEQRLTKDAYIGQAIFLARHYAEKGGDRKKRRHLLNDYNIFNHKQFIVAYESKLRKIWREYARN